jgi:hypothetical protein
MSKKIRVDFYRVDTQDPSVLFEDVIQKISDLPHDESRNVEIRGFPIRLQDSSSQRSGFWRGDLVRIRMNSIPTKASLSGETEPLDLDDDEGLGEETAFLYHIATKVLMLQCNRLGVSASAFARYCQELCQLDKNIFFNPILKGDVMAQLAKMQIVRKLKIQVAGLEDLDILRDQNQGVNEILNIRDVFSSPNVYLTVSVGNRRKTSLENVKETATKLFRLAGDNAGNVKKIEVSGASEEDEQTEAIDLLEYWMKEWITINPTDPRSVTYPERIQALEQAWSRGKEDLQKMFPPT